MKLTLDNIRDAFAVQQELNERAERIIQTYFAVAQPRGYASGARVDNIDTAQSTISIKYDWTNCGTEEEWKEFPVDYVFLNDEELRAQMANYVAVESENNRIERERQRAASEREREATERRQYAALKAKYDPS